MKWGSTWYLKRIYKFGLELPKTVNKAYAINEENGYAIWQDAIQKEMENVKIAFQTIPEGKKPPNGFKCVNCHIVLDIKMKDFQKKAHLVAGGKMTQT